MVKEQWCDITGGLGVSQYRNKEPDDCPECMNVQADLGFHCLHVPIGPILHGIACKHTCTYLHVKKLGFVLYGKVNVMMQNQVMFLLVSDRSKISRSYLYFYEW